MSTAPEPKATKGQPGLSRKERARTMPQILPAAEHSGRLTTRLVRKLPSESSRASGGSGAREDT